MEAFEYLVNIFIVIAIYSILSMGLNLVVGYTGLFSLAHAAFYGVGAYATAILTTQHGFDFISATAIGILASMILASLVGMVLSRFQGDFYAIGSMGFSIIMLGVFLNIESVTNGALGIYGIMRPTWGPIDLSSNFIYGGVLLVVVLIVAALTYYIEKSSFGRILMAIREDETMVQVFGYRTEYFKLTAFLMSAALAALAGSFFAIYTSFIDPFSFQLSEGIFVAIILIVGGLASIPGTLLGAGIMVLLPEVLRFLGMPPEIAAQMRQVIYGLILVVLMIYRPKGILGKFRM